MLGRGGVGLLFGGQLHRLQVGEVHRPAGGGAAAVARGHREKIGIGRGQTVLGHVQAHDLLLGADPKTHRGVNKAVDQEHGHQGIGGNGCHTHALYPQVS